MANQPKQGTNIVPLRTQVQQLNARIRHQSALIDRLQLAARAGVQFDDKRDLYLVFGYKRNLNYQHFLAKYARQGIAGRVVDAPPEATWSDPPVFDGSAAQEKVLDELVKKFKLWSMLERTDRLSRLGRFATMLIGIPTGRVQGPPQKRTSNKVVYLRPLGETQVSIHKFVEDPTDERFGLPELYKVQFDSPIAKSIGVETVVKRVDAMDVHWARMLHVTENPLDDDVVSTPTIAKIFNDLDDLLKVSGGTSEMYWLGARQGIQADVDKEMEIDPQDAADLADELEEYQHQLRRIIRTRGVKLNVLESQAPNPESVFDMIISLISGATGIPKRILTGSEVGQLASEQDRANWAERIQERRALFAEPYILNPFIDRLIMLGVMPEGDYSWKWPEAFKESPLERSQTMAAKARAVGNLSRQTGNKTPMQITSEKEAREIVGFTGKIPDAERFNQPVDVGPTPANPDGLGPDGGTPE